MTWDPNSFKLISTKHICRCVFLFLFQNAVDKDIGQVENKLGVTHEEARPATTRPGTRARTSRGGRRKSTAAPAADEENAPSSKKGKKNGGRVVSEVSELV